MANNQPVTERSTEKNDPPQGSNLKRRTVLKTAAATGATLSGIGALTNGAAAAPGDRLGEVELPGHSSGVGITFDGQYVYTMDGLTSTVLQIYEPPVGGDGIATVVSEKDVVDGSGNSVTLSAIEWDSSRNQLWGAYNGANAVYLVNIGDPADGSQDAVATFQFAPDTGGFSLTDGLAYDGRDDTLWYSPDVAPTVTHFQSDGTEIGTVQPKNADGNTVRVSGVAVGTDHNGRPTLYVGKHGPEQILRVYADDGAFINEFATTGFRIEDLACDPVTYAPNEAILTKNAYDNKYVAFEVEAGTCPLVEPCPAESTRLLAGQDIEIGSVTVEEDEDSLNVTYTTTRDWYLRETHLHLAEDCDDIPQTRSGNPQVGQFDFASTHDPAVQEHTVEVPFNEDWGSGDTVCIAAHADVQEIVDDEVVQEEGAWGEGERFTERGNWAMHFEYEVC